MTQRSNPNPYLNNLTAKVIGVAITIHKTLGPGFIEKIYQRALVIDLQGSGLKVQTEFPIVVRWKNKILGKQNIDLLVEDNLVLELKAQSNIENIHFQQILSYLKAANKPLGLILNFGGQTLGIKRVINTEKELLRSLRRQSSVKSALPKTETQKTQKNTQKSQKEFLT